MYDATILILKVHFICFVTIQFGFNETIKIRCTAINVIFFLRQCFTGIIRKKDRCYITYDYFRLKHMRRGERKIMLLCVIYVTHECFTETCLLILYIF
jgi:hypothetical protein